MFIEIFEAFTDMGKLSDDELKKGQRLFKGDKFIEVPAVVFYNAIKKIRTNDIAKGDKAKGLDTLTIYSKKEYSAMRCFIGINNSSGYAIKGKDLVSVFSSQKSSGSAIVQSAIKNGARTLDCFATHLKGKLSGDLYGLYTRNGFKINKITSGNLGEPYSIQDGISRFVNDKGEVELDNPAVVIFMKHN